MTEKEIEQAKREKLRREKPFVFEKVINIEKRHKLGLATPIIDIAYDYLCNLKCSHCTASRFSRKGGRSLTVADLRRISNEAHKLGFCQFCISGGEPLIFKDLDKVILALQPDKFHLTMSTNGHFLTLERARHLKNLGLDKVKISLDDFRVEEHEKNRKSKGAYQKAIDALFNAKEAGLSVVVQTVVTHQNCMNGQLIEMAEFATKNNFILDVLIARALGAWEGKHEVLIDAKDSEYLLELHKKYPCLHRDTFPSYGMDKGCSCVDSTLHITKYGDVMPCAYIHIAIGNIFQETLEEIVKRGQSIKHFKKYSRLCLSGEDRDFINNYMTKFYGKPLPIHWSEAFKGEDFCED